jgi:endonuclease/exonuclease/phosphatase family metal-dependent hydrolase
MKSFQAKTAAEAWENQVFEEPQDLRRSNVLSSPELAKYREAKGIIRWLFLTIMSGLLLCGSAPAAKAADNITAMSFNILRQAWQTTAPSWDTQRKADVVQTIQDKSPDFVGTQEEGGGQMEDLLVELPAYLEVPGRDTSRTGGILYLHEKWNLVEHGRTNFSGTYEISTRYFIWGLFTEKTTNRMIYVYSLHLSTANQATLSERVAAMELMGTHAANRQQQTAPVILTGDFNSTVDIDTMRTLTGEMGSLPIEFIYAFQDVPVTNVSYGIDHILALPGTVVVDSGVAASMKWNSGSDHPAVFAVIEPWFGDLSGYPDGSVRVEATDPTATEEGQTTATFRVIREGDTSSSLLVNFSVGGTATQGDDYALSASSPVTIPAGQSSVDIILTPTDDTVFGERSQTVTLTITAGTGYDEFGTPATATIEDNDNHEPVAYAGVDKLAVLAEAAWSPADIATTAWYDASAVNTVSTSGVAVSAWQDKSGNGNNATQLTFTNRPVTGGAINGLNAIDFNPGAGKQHLTTNLEQLTTVSMYLVVHPTARGANGYSAAIGASAAGYGANSGLFWPLEQYSTATQRNDVHYTNSLLDKAFCNGVEDSADHNFQPAILSHQGTNLPTANLNYLIGNRSADLQEIFAYKGLMGEIIICPEEHNLATRQKMEGYLAHKWGLTAKLPVGHPYINSAPNVSVASASVTLTDATISDADAGDPLTQNWEVVSKPSGAPNPTFSSITAINPTVTFTAAGTYELRLTASDGYAPHSDNVTIDVYSEQYWAWANSDFANDLTDKRLDADPDGDGLNSLLEFAFGTDPTVGSGSALATDGSAHGQPKAAPGESGMELFFVRRKDYGTSGSVTYRVEFSGDLAAFFTIAVEPSFVANSSSNADYEVVKVPFPAMLPDALEGRFGRIVIAPMP